MAQNTYPITGIPLVAGQSIPTRQEITAWYDEDANKYQVSLFLQALTKMEETPIEQLLSYFQVAGIHCYPLVSWDGEGPASQPRGTDPLPGFCAHNLVTFPTWHRPYMLLYEQVLYELMKDLIKAWQLSPAEEQVWSDAADQFRLPYWDWARKQSYAGNFAIPQLCVVQTVEVVVPGGQKKLIQNPLVKFTNPKKVNGQNVAMGDVSMGKNAIKNDTDVSPGSDPLPWSECVGTSRYGIYSDKPVSAWKDGVNNYEEANAAIASPPWYGQSGGTFADAVSRMLSPGYFDSYEAFSSTVHNDAQTATDFLSLEYIHNLVHNATGGTFLSSKDAQGQPAQGIGLGHMSDVPVAAFDPIFWLHHCNVDRLFAIWQALNPSMWFDKPQQGDPAPTAPLLPFHYNTTKGLYDSDRCRDWTKLNYQYDDLVPKADAVNPDGSINQERYIRDLRTHINDLYTSTSHLVKRTPGFTLDNNKFHDYVINVVYDRYALQGRAYSILFFLGDLPSDLSSYRNEESYIGQVYTFSAPVEVDGAVACANCARQKDSKVLSTGQVPITLPLLSKATRLQSQRTSDASQAYMGISDFEFGALDPDAVERVLEAGLKWVFVEIGGRRRDAADFPDTEVGAMRGQGQHAASSHQLPRYSGYKKMERATRGHLTGCGHPETRLQMIRDDPE